MHTLNNPHLENYAALFKQARIEAGLTQKELAVGLEISLVMVSRYEAGTARPSDKTAWMIQRFFEERDRTREVTVTPELVAQDLSTYSLDALLAEIKRRGFKISLESLP